MTKHKLNPKVKRMQLVLNSVLLFIVLGILIFLFASGRVGISKENPASDVLETQEKPESQTQTQTQEEELREEEPKTEDIYAYLFMGIDASGTVDQVEETEDGGQSDAMFLLLVHEQSKKLSLISIHRNTMAKVTAYTAKGNKIGEYDMQICLQHAYGDGKKVSCSRSVDAVSNLFKGIPIHGYFSLRMDAIGSLNDALGGVTITYTEEDAELFNWEDVKVGQEVTLTNQQAVEYLRNRSMDEFDSATQRLKRQESYISALFVQAQEGFKNDKKQLLRVLESIGEYTVTNISLESFLDKVAQCTLSEHDVYTIPGETVMGETLEEFHIDEPEFQKIINKIWTKEDYR